MPTIIRFVMTLAVLAALVGAAMFYLANFVKPNIHQMTVRIPTDQLDPVPISKPPPPAEAQPSDAVSGDAAPPE